MIGLEASARERKEECWRKIEKLKEGRMDKKRRKTNKEKECTVKMEVANSFLELPDGGLWSTTLGLSMGWGILRPPHVSRTVPVCRPPALNHLPLQQPGAVNSNGASTSRLHCHRVGG